MLKAVIWDLDQTLADTSHLERFRDARDWPRVYQMIDSVHPYDGIVEIISLLGRSGIKAALVSSSPKSYCMRIVAHFGWRFDTEVCYHDTTQRKPHPAPILLAVQRLAVDKNEVLSLGDRDIDIAASNSAGVLSGACLWGSKDKNGLLRAKPGLVFESPMDCLRYIERQIMSQ